MTPQEIQKNNQDALKQLVGQQIQTYNANKNYINPNEPFEIKNGKFVFKKKDNRKYAMGQDGRLIPHVETPTPTAPAPVPQTNLNMGESTMNEKCGCMDKKKKNINNINKMNKKNPIDEKIEMDLDDVAMDKYGKEFNKLLSWQKEKVKKFVKNPTSTDSQSIVKMKNDKDAYKSVGQVWGEGTLADRLENIMMSEDDMSPSNDKLEDPIQGNASVEANKDNEEPEEKKEEPKENKEDIHKEFMTLLKPTFEKVKNNQIVTWEELKKLAEMYDKVGDV